MACLTRKGFTFHTKKQNNNNFHTLRSRESTDLYCSNVTALLSHSSPSQVYQPKLWTKNEAKHIWPDEKLPRTCSTLLKVTPAIKIPPGRTQGIFFFIPLLPALPPCSAGEFTSTIYSIRLLPNDDIMFKICRFDPLTVMNYIKTKPKESGQPLKQHAHTEQTGSCLNGATASPLSCSCSVDDQSTASSLTAQKVV